MHPKKVVCLFSRSDYVTSAKQTQEAEGTADLLQRRKTTGVLLTFCRESEEEEAVNAGGRSERTARLFPLKA